MAGTLLRGINHGINHILFGGASASDLAPFNFEVGLGQFAYNIDYTYADQFNLNPVQALRPQQDTRDAPGEHSIDPIGLWRRSANSWHLGAGQAVYDRKTSSEFRFEASTGTDIWTKYHLGLLHDTDQKRSSSNTNLRFAVAGTHLYLTNGTALEFTTNVDVDTPTWTPLSGTPPANAATSIVSDGFNIFTAHGSNGIFKTTRGTAAWAGAAHITGTTALLGYVRGRVLAANANSVWDVTVAAEGGGGVALGGAGAPLLFTHPNTDFVWKAFAEGRNAVYMAGYSGDKSLIYKAVIKSDGTGLDAPVVASEFDGETIESIYGYLGPFLAIGTSLQNGWRFALVNNNGDLNVGSRVNTPQPVRCFEGQDNFIWWGNSNYTSALTGLGRFNVQDFGDPEHLVPAWASDLMCTAQGEVLSVVTFQGIRVYTVSAIGVFATHHLRNLVPSGTLDTGEILFDMNEDKIAMFLDVVQIGMGGTHGFYFAVEDGPFAFVGEHEEHHETFKVGMIQGRAFRLRVELKRDSVDLTDVQKLGAWLFRALIIPSVSRVFTIPVYIASRVTSLEDIEFVIDPLLQMDNIQTLHSLKPVTQLKLWNRAYPVVVRDYKFRFHKVDDPNQYGPGFNGTCVITMQIMTEDI